MKKTIITCLLLTALLATSVPAAFAQSTREFSIECNVSGAAVYLNDNLAGYTRPNFTAQLRPGTYRVRVQMEQYGTFEDVIKMSSRAIHLSVNLAREGAVQGQQPQGRFNLTVTTNVDGARVFVNNDSVGTAPLALQVDRGTYSVRVTAPGYQDYQVSVTVTGNTVVNAVLAANLVSVRIVIPDGFLDDGDNWDGDNWDGNGTNWDGNGSNWESSNRNSRYRIRLYVDGQFSDTSSFSIAPGKHNIRISSGSFSFDADFNFLQGRSYVLEPVFSWNVR